MEQALANEPVQNEPVASVEATEQAPVTEGEVKAVPERAEESPKKELTELERVKYGMQKRIDRQTARLSEMERRYQSLQQEIEGYRKKPEDGAPKEDDFENVEDYLKAVGKWEAKQEIEKTEKTRKEEDLKKAYMSKLEAKRAMHEAKEAEFRKAMPDYDDAVQVLNEYLATVDPNTDGFRVFRDVMLGSKDMAAMSYHLSKNPEMLETLAKSEDPIDVARVLFRVEYDLERAPKDKPKSQPKPPEASKSGAGKSVKRVDEMSARELVKWANS
jgi:hypothetical protein